LEGLEPEGPIVTVTESGGPELDGGAFVGSPIDILGGDDVVDTVAELNVGSVVEVLGGAVLIGCQWHSSVISGGLTDLELVSTVPLERIDEDEEVVRPLTEARRQDSIQTPACGRARITHGVIKCLPVIALSSEGGSNLAITATKRGRSARDDVWYAR
jgi:hypothetical protein